MERELGLHQPPLSYLALAPSATTAQGTQTERVDGRSTPGCCSAITSTPAVSLWMPLAVGRLGCVCPRAPRVSEASVGLGRCPGGPGPLPPPCSLDSFSPSWIKSQLLPASADAPVKAADQAQLLRSPPPMQESRPGWSSWLRQGCWGTRRNVALCSLCHFLFQISRKNKSLPCFSEEKGRCVCCVASGAAWAGDRQELPLMTTWFPELWSCPLKSRQKLWLFSQKTFLRTCRHSGCVLGSL